MRYSTVLFDLDGTLTDPAEGITSAVRHALTGVGRPLPPYEELLRFIGPPLLEAFHDFCGMDEEEALRALALFRAYYTETGIHQNRLLPYARELLVSLKTAGLTLILATSKPEVQARAVLADFGILDLFDVVSGSTLDQSRAKKEDVILYALDLAGSPAPTDCLMVGDRFYDVIGARACGIDTLGVLCGYGSAEELSSAGAVALVEDLCGVENFLLRRPPTECNNIR